MMADKFDSRDEALFHTLLDASSSLIIILNAELKIERLNPAASNLFAKSESALKGENILSVLPQQGKDVVRAHLMVVQRSQQAHHFQLMLGERLFTTSLHPVMSGDLLHSIVIVADDETEQKRMEDDLFLSNQILSTVQHPMAILDDQESFRRVNDAFMSVFSPKERKLENLKFGELFSNDKQREMIVQQFTEAKTGVAVDTQNWYDLPGLGKRFLRIHVYPLFSGRKTISGLVFHAMDLTEMKLMEEKLHQLSITDALTGLFNRNHFQNLSEAEMSRSSRYGIPLSFIMFDIDHFKRINDTFGHDNGDMVLKSISALVKRKVRDTDSLFRWGGEEFILMLPHTTSNEAVVLAERIRLDIENLDHERIGRVTCSFGVTAYRGREPGQALFNRLDDLLYESKNSGRNRVTAE